MQQEVIEAATAASSEVPEVNDVPAITEQSISDPSQDMTSMEPNRDSHDSSMIKIPDYMTAELNAADEQKAEKAPTENAEKSASDEKKSDSVAADSFEVTVHGVEYVAADGKLFRKITNNKDETTLVFVSSLIVVVANARDSNSSSWGKVIRFEDQDDIRKELFIPNQDIATDSKSVIKRLVKEGLVVSTHRGMVEALAHYLNLASPIITTKAQCSDRIGWHENVYLFHDNSVIGNSDKSFVYTGDPVGNCHATKGTLQDWKKNVAALCQGNSLLILAVSVAFAAVLLRLLKVESCGYHYFGDSSTGKSTTLYVAASAHGEPDSMFGSWNTTIAGMEGRSKKFTDSLLINDELHECNPKDAGKLIYMIMNGKGRQRSNVLGGAREVADWRVCCLSSGEESSEGFIRSNGGNPRAGHAVRMVDISANMDAGFGVFENIHGAESSHAFAEQIKKAAQENYGTPIREFLHKLVGRIDRIDDQFNGIKVKFFETFVPEKSDSQVKRVASKMVVAAMAGEIATAMGITGWNPNEAFESVGGIFTRWLSSRGTIGQQEPEKAVEQVKSFLQRHGMSRFVPLTVRSNGSYALDGPERQINNMAGFRVTKDDDLYEFIVMPETFKSEMCQGLIPKNVTKTLGDRGYLFPDSGDHKPQSRLRMPGYLQARYYHFTSAILSDEDELELADPETEE